MLQTFWEGHKESRQNFIVGGIVNLVCGLSGMVLQIRGCRQNASKFYVSVFKLLDYDNLF